MALGGWFKGLFGGGGEAASAEPRTGEPVEHKGYEIVPAPRPNEGGWNVAAIVRREVGGELREYRFIRADSDASWDGAAELSVIKARQMIDNEGERIFDNQSVF